MKKVFIGLALVIVAIGALVLYGLNTPQKQMTVRIGDTVVTAEAVGTPAQQTKGLSGRETLEPSKGMLFVFRELLIVQFWMKDMEFPIDIIWIGADNTVVGVSENLQPSSYPELFSPRQGVQYALEVNAGFVAAHGIKVGDAVTISE